MALNMAAETCQRSSCGVLGRRAAGPAVSLRPVLGKSLVGPRVAASAGCESRSSTVAASSSWLVPQQLLEHENDGFAASSSSSSSSREVARPRTVYTVRVSTGMERGAALSEPLAAVNICLIAKDGRALLHRISPVNDPEETRSRMHTICNVVDELVGANCKDVTPGEPPAAPPAWPGGKVPPIKARFQEGSVDEVSFLAPELGPLAAILVAPESGTWALDEVHVCSSRTNHMDRFVCRKRLGGRKGETAGYLTPVPPGAVVYGQGDAAVVLTKEQAATLRRMGLNEYVELKQRLLLLTAALTVGGSSVAALASGMEAAVPFALGGLAGLVYQYLLQLGVEAALPVSAAPAVASGQRMRQVAGAGALEAAQHVFGSPAFRLALVGALALTAAFYATETPIVTSLEGSGQPADSALALRLPAAEAWQLGVGALGFMMYKVAVLGVSLTPGKQELEPAKQYEKNV